MKQTKIDWCDCTVNPVVGCNRGCAYCYAKRINDRFHFIEKWDNPQFFPERLKQFDSKKPKSIFINSMSDIANWGTKWVIALFRAMIKNPQHRYIALTKSYEKWEDLRDKVVNSVTDDFYLLNQIFYVGRTATDNLSLYHCYSKADFINIEPILEAIDTDNLIDYYSGEYPLGKAIIVGAETGNRKGKVIPKKQWIDKLVEFADKWEIPIFMKESLRNIMGKDFRQDKLPWNEIKS